MHRFNENLSWTWLKFVNYIDAKKKEAATTNFLTIRLNILELDNKEDGKQPLQS